MLDSAVETAILSGKSKLIKKKKIKGSKGSISRYRKTDWIILKMLPKVINLGCMLELLGNSNNFR